MREAYGLATREIVDALRDGGPVLDCGAGSGRIYAGLAEQVGLSRDDYFGAEWDAASVADGQAKGLQISQVDLNRRLPFADGQFACVYGLSVLEHLLNGCLFMRECQRVLRPGGRLVLLTPNIATYFTAVLVLLGKMPSSGPHPDSDALLKHEELFPVSTVHLQTTVETDTPIHRHLVVFSYRVLRDFLQMLGFREVRGYGFGVYPFPNLMQPLLERIDPYHCHQMVFIAER